MFADAFLGCTVRVPPESVSVQKLAADDMDLALDRDNSKLAVHYSDIEQIE